MSIRPTGYGLRGASVRPIGARPTFIPRPPVAGGPGAGLGAGAGGIGALIGGLGIPLLCLGCLASLALLGLFATMIGAAAYMNGIQKQVRKQYEGSGAMLETNTIVLFGALLCSFYVLFKHQFGAHRST